MEVSCHFQGHTQRGQSITQATHEQIAWTTKQSVYLLHNTAKQFPSIYILLTFMCGPLNGTENDFFHGSDFGHLSLKTDMLASIGSEIGSSSSSLEMLLSYTCSYKINIVCYSECNAIVHFNSMGSTVPRATTDAVQLTEEEQQSIRAGIIMSKTPS